jgi:hypothetical protein
MIEVFKTNVSEGYQAEMLCIVLQNAFPEYEVNFDLQDCDKILRIKGKGMIDPKPVIELMESFSFHAEVLPDVILHSLSGQQEAFSKVLMS